MKSIDHRRERLDTLDRIRAELDLQVVDAEAGEPLQFAGQGLSIASDLATLGPRVTDRRQRPNEHAGAGRRDEAFVR